MSHDEALWDFVAECGEQCVKLHDEIDKLRTQFAEANARCAELTEALTRHHAPGCRSSMYAERCRAHTPCRCEREPHLRLQEQGACDCWVAYTLTADVPEVP